jgi:GTPase
MTETPKRAGFVTIIGRPNVGKSTLLNAILGEKLAIVSNRPQTTRNRILGVKTRGSDQLVLVDTPGIHRHKSNLNKFMVQEALAGAAGVNAIVFVTEVNSKVLKKAAEADTPADTLRLVDEDRYVLEQIKAIDDQRPVILVINKIDRVKERQHLLPLMEMWHRQGFETIIPISALQNDGVDGLLEALCTFLPEGEHIYPEDMLTDKAERFLASEYVREQVFLRCHEEIPYATAVEIERYETRPSGDIMVEGAIIVERSGQKAIIIGKRGQMIKEIGTAARQQLGDLLGQTVHMKLTVRVDPDWSHRPTGRRRFGYE